MRRPHVLQYLVGADLLMLETSKLLVTADPKPEAIARHCHVQTLPAYPTPQLELNRRIDAIRLFMFVSPSQAFSTEDIRRSSNSVEERQTEDAGQAHRYHWAGHVEVE